MIAACMAASGPGSFHPTDATDNGSQMNSEACREMFCLLCHIQLTCPLGSEGGKCGPCQFDNSAGGTFAQINVWSDIKHLQ